MSETPVLQGTIVASVEPKVPPCELWISFYLHGGEWCMRTVGGSREFVEARQSQADVSNERS